jgi:nitric oxide reductase large subunit
MTTRKLWLGFIAVMTISFGVLLYYGREIYREAPPVPEKVVTADGTVIFSGQEIKDGQNVWQSLGGHQLGTIWGHGAYQAPDWSADWLHKEAVFMLFVLRDLNTEVVWKEKSLKIAFWGMNIGLIAMVVFSMLPIGLLQTLASVKEGLWYARSAEFMQQDHMVTLKWLRAIGDTIFAVGIAALAWFIFGLKGGWSLEKK